MVYHDSWEIYEQIYSLSGPSLEVDVESMRRLFIDKPEEAQRRFLYGRTLLHWLVQKRRFDRLDDLLDVILDVHPVAAKTEDDYGDLPLHLLLMNINRYMYPMPAAGLVRKLVSLFPEIAMTPTRGGSLPLHLACENLHHRPTNDDDITTIRLLVGYFPDACRYRDGSGKFPLDYILELAYPNPQIVHLLIDEFPVILSFPDTTDSGRLPLHKLLKKQKQSRCSYDDDFTEDEDKVQRAVELVVNAFEGCLRLQDGQFVTPLLQACIDDNPLTQVYYLLRAWPEQVGGGGASHLVFDDTNFNGEILYSSLAMMSSSSKTKSSSLQVEHVERWLQRNPDLISTPDLNGRLPLHYAVLSESDRAHQIILLCSGSSSRGVVHNEQMQQQQPPVQSSSSASLSSSSRRGESENVRPNRPIETVDNDGRLPIHYAAASPTCRREILEYLIESYPEGLLVADREGRLPWHYADCSRQDMVYEKTCVHFPNIDSDLNLVPEEIRWDIVQVIPDYRT